MQKTTIVIIVIIVLIVGFVTIFAGKSAVEPGQYDSLAKCVTESGAKFYGAFWCPHCRAQKEMFGKSAEFLPYQECSTADGKDQLPICDQANIDSYPTWEFADGSRLTGEVPLETLAEKTSCSL